MSQAPRPSAPSAAIYLDANPLADRHLTGIGRYTARLALALARRTPIRFFSNGTELEATVDGASVEEADLGRWGRRIWNSPRRPLTGIPERSAGIHGCLRPVERIFPFEISILYDFTPVVVPATHSETTRELFRGFYAESLLSSDRALAISHSTKADAAWLTSFDPEKIRVAHPGPSLCAARHQDERPVTRRPNVGLVVSTLEPRKNATFLLDWFRETDALPPGSELWWVGPIGWLTSKRSLRKYRHIGNGRRIRFLGVVSDRALCRLYRTAGWSIYPSLYEGFGFPVLDALRHGAPVLTSANSALIEFEMPGVFFFDPKDPRSVDEAWTAFRQQSPVSIPLDALEARYDWDRVARTLIDMVEERFATGHTSIAA